LILITLLNIAIFQGIVLGIIILKSPIFNSKANKYLAFAIFSLSNSLLSLVIEIIEISDRIPILRLFDILDSGFTFPAFIFLFIVHQVDHPIKRSKKLLWLIIPYLCILINSIFSEFHTSYPSFNVIQGLIVILDFIHLLIVLFLIPGILIYTYSFIKYSTNVREKKWLTHLWLLTFIIFISWVLVVFLNIFFEYDLTFIMRSIALFSTLLIHWTAYFGIFKFKLATDQEEIKALIDKRKRNYVHQAIKETDASKTTNEKKVESLTKDNPYFKKLEDLCINHEIYRDSTLDRNKVAEKLGISPGYVSQLVNTITGNNFATYINHYRVEAVKDIILDSEFDNYNLLAIGLECGFSSKTTFHNSFKKITGITPNAYRKMHK